MRLISKRKAWRVARTTRGEPDLDSFADITLIVPNGKDYKKMTPNHQGTVLKELKKKSFKIHPDKSIGISDDFINKKNLVKRKDERHDTCIF